MGGIILPIQERRGRRYRLLVGADVSKDFFCASGLGAEGKERFSGTYEMSSHGFSGFLKTLSSHGERLDQIRK